MCIYRDYEFLLVFSLNYSYITKVLSYGKQSSYLHQGRRSLFLCGQAIRENF